MRTLQRDHLIDGRGLKEDCICKLSQKLEWFIKDNVCERIQHVAFAQLRQALEVFEDECVSYDRSKNFVEGENGDLDDEDDEDEELNEKDALNPRILVIPSLGGPRRDYSFENDKTVLPVEVGEVWLDNHERQWLISKIIVGTIYGIRQGTGKTRECTWMLNGGGNYGFSRLVKRLESSRLKPQEGDSK